MKKTTYLGLALAVVIGTPGQSSAREQNVARQIRDSVGASAKGASSSTGAAVYKIRPQQVRTYCSNGKVELIDYVNGAGLPIPAPAGCPSKATAPKFDSVDEIIGGYTPNAAPPGTNMNAAGEGILGYFDFGPQLGNLRCNPGMTPAIFALITTSGADEDCVAVMRFDLRGVPGAGTQPVNAALDIQAFQRSFWTTLSAKVCQHRYTRNGVDETATYLADDEPASPGDKAPVNPDCIVTGRDFTGDGFNIFDVVTHEGIDNPGTEGGGMTHIPFFADFFPHVTFPLSSRASGYIARGGTDGFVDIILRIADPRGSHTEGPTSARGTPVPAHPNAVNANIFVVEDDNGVFFNNPFRRAETNLVITVPGTASDPLELIP